MGVCAHSSALRHFVFALILFSYPALNFAQPNFRIVYFSALSSEDESNIQKLAFSLQNEFSQCAIEVENFYEPEQLKFDVRFGAAAFMALRSSIRSSSSREKKKLEKLVKPQFSALSFNQGLKQEPKNFRGRADDPYFEEDELSRLGNTILIWPVSQNEGWDWSKLRVSGSHRGHFLEEYDLKSNKKWEKGYQGKKQFYKGRSMFRTRFINDVKKNWAENSEQSEMVIVYANDKVESDFSCEKMASKQAENPSVFKVSHEYEERYSTTIRPNDSSYQLSFKQGADGIKFRTYEIKVEVATGAFAGNVFEPVHLNLGDVSIPGRLSENMGEVDLNLNVAWLGAQCMKVSGEEYVDPDCECREECLYQKHFYVSIRGVSQEDCDFEIPWSDRMRISFQCEK